MSQIPNTSPNVPAGNPGTTPPAPDGNSAHQQGGQPGAGGSPSGNAPEAGAGLLFNAGQTPPEGGTPPAPGNEPGKEGGEPKPEGVPEKYELNLKEGYAWDEATAAAVTPMFKELGLNNAQAQKLADYHMEAMQKFQASQVQKFHEIQAAELAATKADPEVGGAKLDASLALAAKAMDTYGGQEFRDALAAHGMANNVTMLRFLAKVGRALSGDSFVHGSKPQTAPDRGSVLYPDMAH